MGNLYPTIASKRDSLRNSRRTVGSVGHLGIAETIARIASKYYWPRMYQISLTVRTYPSCQAYKPSQQLTTGEMQFPKISCPWDTVSIDIVEPLPRSSKCNTYLIVFQDRFTKWVECHPMRKATVENVSQAFNEKFVSRFGCPSTVLSDNGKQFVSTEFIKMLSQFGINKRTTPPCSPQCNPVERCNKVLKTMVAQYAEGDRKKWDAYLPKLTWQLIRRKMNPLDILRLC